MDHRVAKSMVFVLISVIANTAYSEFPRIEQDNITHDDSRLGGPIDRSKSDELTIASFNVRNLGAKRRSVRDFEVLIDLVDEADIIVFQEFGLGVFDSDPELSDVERKRIESVEALIQIQLGEGWMLARSPEPSGSGLGAEMVLVAMRKKTPANEIRARWLKWVDLGPRRDLGIFAIELTRGTAKKEFLLGSVHLKPTDPIRGEEMNRVADWLVQQQDAIVVGDFNWGYKKKSNVENYKGEAHVRKLHSTGKLFQLFHELSYENGNTHTKLRTNLSYRGRGYMYDQILTTPSFASRLADGGKLLKDCGIIAFGDIHPYVIERRLKGNATMKYGLDRFIEQYREEYEVDDEVNDMVDKIVRRVETRSNDDVTYSVSDHRAIWVQFKIW